jgi:DNA-binding beta-propeller fold protein YncE
LQQPHGVTLDGAGYLYVADCDSNAILVFAPGANGNVAPVRTISGANTTLNCPVMGAVL